MLDTMAFKPDKNAKIEKMKPQHNFCLQAESPSITLFMQTENIANATAWPEIEITQLLTLTE